MKKYKFKLDQKVYPVGTKRVYLENSKHKQKWEGVVVGRYKDAVTETNLYVVQTNLGTYLVKENGLTSQKERLYCYLLIRDINDYTKYDEKPEVVPEGSKLLAIMVIPND